MTRRLAIAILAAFAAGYLAGQADASTPSPAPSAVVRVQSEQVDGRRFESVPRCRDHRDCRERVTLLGEAWPVVEPREAVRT